MKRERERAEEKCESKGSKIGAGSKRFEGHKNQGKFQH
jgi:hypothetical protein